MHALSIKLINSKINKNALNGKDFVFSNFIFLIHNGLDSPIMFKTLFKRQCQ